MAEDLFERMKTVMIEDANAGDTFAERAEWYYQKRPQLLRLLKDLYDGYTTLLNTKHTSQFLTIHQHYQGEEEEESDGETSCLSFQHPGPQTQPQQSYAIIDDIVADLVMNNVENELLRDQISDTSNESWRKIELLKKLLEVLESERMVLLNENVKLSYKVTAVMEENQVLSSELMFMKRKASELARCVIKMREDQRVCMLSKKIENLQDQIYGLERKNKDWYHHMLLKEEDHHQVKPRNFKGFQSPRFNNRAPRHGHGKKLLGWFKRVKNMDFFMCGTAIHHTCFS